MAKAARKRDPEAARQGILAAAEALLIEGDGDFEVSFGGRRLHTKHGRSFRATKNYRLHCTGSMRPRDRF